MITTEKLRELSESDHPTHGDLARLAKELGQLRAQIATQTADRAKYREGYHDIIREISAERNALRAELEAESREHAADVSKCSSTINALRAEVSSLRSAIDRAFINEVKRQEVAAPAPAIAQMVRALETARSCIMKPWPASQEDRTETAVIINAALDAAKGISA